jgi:hypothetical protein
MHTVGYQRKSNSDTTEEVIDPLSCRKKKVNKAYKLLQIMLALFTLLKQPK